MPYNKAKNWISSSRQFDGISLNTGVGLGKAVIHQSYSNSLQATHKISKNVSKATELARLHQALNLLVDEIVSLISDQAISTSVKSTHSESKEILDVTLMLAKDPGWKRQLIEHVEAGNTAVEAVDATLQSICNTLNSKGKKSIWKERISDFEDLSSRLKRHLSTSMETSEDEEEGTPIIVVADRIGPAELLDYDRKRLAGLILVEHSQTAHVAIVARSLDIPVVGGMKSAIAEIHRGDTILVDGDEARVYVRPINDIIRRFDIHRFIKKTRHIEPRLEKIAALPSITADNVLIDLQLNAGLVEDVDHIEAAGAIGVGLYRTEIPFMMRPKLPNVTEQTNLYREIMARAGSYPVVFRTLDVGGDKVLPYLERLKSENPLRNERVTRVFFDRPILLRYQLRALIRACEGRELRIMLPMIAEVDEVKEAREILDGEIAREKALGNSIPTKISLGAMIEVPSIIFQLSQLFPYVDFLSVGSNDLFQYFYAIDREYPKISNRYDVLCTPFLNLLYQIQQECRAANMPISVCGEMAGRPLEAMALIGLGYQSLSMSAASVPLVKTMIRSLKFKEIGEFMASVCVPGKSGIRTALREFVKDHDVHCD
jgi:phosphotransferase system, enzyme I, PtsP